MKQFLSGTLLLLLLFGLSGCAQNKEGEEETAVVNTFEQTPPELVAGSETVPLKTYREMSDGTWEADGHTYQYKLVVTGRLSNAAKDTTYIILSNLEEITFEQAWKASGLSSNSEDYFSVEDAVFVAIQ